MYSNLPSIIIGQGSATKYGVKAKVIPQFFVLVGHPKHAKDPLLIYSPVTEISV